MRTSAQPLHLVVPLRAIALKYMLETVRYLREVNVTSGKKAHFYEFF